MQKTTSIEKGKLLLVCSVRKPSQLIAIDIGTSKLIELKPQPKYTTKIKEEVTADKLNFNMIFATYLRHDHDDDIDNLNPPE
jgi:hypothetical protein